MPQPDDLAAWIGRAESSEDFVCERNAVLLAATLDRERPPAPGEPLPPLWHWTQFVPSTRASGIGPDGHARRGGFLPPVPLPRRMWAGGRLVFHHPLKIGERAVRRSSIAAVSEKSGKSGRLVFVRVNHLIEDAEGLALSEEQDLVYREPSQGPAPAAPPAPQGGQWADTIRPDPVMLFRYSALTFNAHRIHYDRPYASEAEGYAGLVVHGPLIATLLAESLAKRSGRALASFSFRAASPLFDTAPFTVCGRIDGEHASLWALNPQGALAMSAEAAFIVGKPGAD